MKVYLLRLQVKCIEHRRAGLQDLEDNEKSCLQAIKLESWFWACFMAKSLYKIIGNEQMALILTHFP